MQISQVLAKVGLFKGLVPEALSELSAYCQERQLSSGETLIAIGDVPDALYIVTMGRLRAVLADGVTAGEIGLHEPIGEIAILSGELHGAAVYAIRDSWLLKIHREQLLDFVQRHPSALLEMSRTVISRLRQNRQAVTQKSRTYSRTYAVLPATPRIDARGFAAAFASSIDPAHCRLLDAAGVDRELGAGAAQQVRPQDSDDERLLEFLQAQEQTWRYLVQVADAEPTPWSLCCMRQADRIVIVADPQQPPPLSPMLDALRRSGSRAPVDLVFVRNDENLTTPHTAAWRDRLGAASHYFWRPGNAEDTGLIARSLSGRALGLVLGGGGARGFAHIGLIRALEELRMPVDVIGGSSMGAFIGGLLASGCDSREMMRIARETFVAHNYLNDYLFPSIALIRGRKFVGRLQEIFGDRSIENLQTPYFCVSSNLTRGDAMVHQRGPLAVWIAASMAVPGVAPPVIYEGELLADGAVANSLPTDIMQTLGRGPILASDVSTDGTLRAPGIEGPDPEGLFRWKQLLTHGLLRPSLVSILFRTATLTSASGIAARAARADLYLRMPVHGIGLFDWKRIDELAERGYQLAMQRLESLQQKLALQ